MLNIIAYRLFMSEAVFTYVYDYFYTYSLEPKISSFEFILYFLVNEFSLPLELGLIALIELIYDVYVVFFNEFFLIKDGFFKL